MTATDLTALTAVRKKVYAVQTYKIMRETAFWQQPAFRSSGRGDGTTPVHVVTELTNNGRGDKCIMQLVLPLTGGPVVNNSKLKGNEKALTNDYVEIQLSQARIAIRNVGKMSTQRGVLEFKPHAKAEIGHWWAEYEDGLMFLTASGVSYAFETDGSARAGDDQTTSLDFAADVVAPSSGRKVFAGSATATSNLTANDKVTWRFLVEACAIAKRKRIKELRLAGGKKYFIIVLSTEQARDLKLDPDYMIAVKDAGARGDKNPLFTGALAMVDGMAIYEHRQVFNTLGADSGSKWGAAGAIDGAQALLIGAQALGYAQVKDPEYTQDKEDDYGNEENIGFDTIIGMLKPQFISRQDSDTKQDFSIISLYTAAAPTT